MILTQILCFFLIYSITIAYAETQTTICPHWVGRMYPPYDPQHPPQECQHVVQHIQYYVPENGVRMNSLYLQFSYERDEPYASCGDLEDLLGASCLDRLHVRYILPRKARSCFAKDAVTGQTDLCPLNLGEACTKGQTCENQYGCINKVCTLSYNTICQIESEFDFNNPPKECNEWDLEHIEKPKIIFDKVGVHAATFVYPDALYTNCEQPQTFVDRGYSLGCIQALQPKISPYELRLCFPELNGRSPWCLGRPYDICSPDHKDEHCLPGMTCTYGICIPKPYRICKMTTENIPSVCPNLEPFHGYEFPQFTQIEPYIVKIAYGREPHIAKCQDMKNPPGVRWPPGCWEQLLPTTPQ